MISFYGYKKCSTCRKAETVLEKAGVKYRFVDITETPPSQAELKRAMAAAAVEPKKLFNVSGEQYRALGIKDQLATMKPPEMFALLAGNGRLVKRPFVIDGQRATIGFDEVVFKKTWQA